MKILVAPLNWGLGHASRCVPLVRRFLDEGHEVILGGDGESLTLLRKHFPKLRYTYLAPLNLRYSKGKRLVFAMLMALPKLFVWACKDHIMLRAVLKEEPFDRVVSDNRFGLYINHSSQNPQHPCECIYITHQLHIMLPKGWKWLKPLVARIHARVYTRFNKVWVPDYEDPQNSLAGEMSHPKHVPFGHLPCTIEYIGPLSRFCLTAKWSNSEAVYQSNGLSGEVGPYDTVAVLSGLEPHRTLLEKEIVARYQDSEERVLIVQGLMNRPNTRIKRGNLTVVPNMSDVELVPALLGAKHIIARSGYSTIMDLHALGLLSSSPKDGLTAQRFNNAAVQQQSGLLVELIPTPGQPEQEYLATLHNKMK